jgi:hypothetical protein
VNLALLVRHANLIFGQVDEFNVSEVGKHLEVNLGQLVPGEIDGSNPEIRGQIFSH